MCLLRYIVQEGHKLELAQVQVPMTVTNAVSWRGPNINYRKNECFLDVIESVDVLVRQCIPPTCDFGCYLVAVKCF